MSTTLPNVDLSSTGVGSTGKIDLSQISGGGGVPFQSNDKATLRLHNDSGSGLRITLPKSSQQFNLPAGGWVDCYPSPGETQAQFLVLSLLPNPPITLLMSTYFFPGEDVPPMTILGNSPVGIGGTVNTSGVNTLSNEGNPANTLVIDIGDAALSQLIKIYASGQAIWKVDQSGVAHQVLNIQISGNPLQLGQAGDIVEILGKLTVDQLLTVGAGITVNASGITISAGGLGVTGGAVIDSLTVTGAAVLDSGLTSTGNVFASGNFSIGGGGLLYSTLASGTGLSIAAASSLDNGNITTNGAGVVSAKGVTDSGNLSVTGTSSLDNGAIASDGTGNVTFANNKFLQWKDSTNNVHSVIGFTSGNDPVLRTASNNSRLLVEDGSGNVIAAFSNNQNGTDTITEGAIECQKVFFNTGSIKDLNNGSNLSGTINHGLTGTPAAVLATCNTASSSATTGAYSYTSTQFGLTVGSSLNARWVAYR